MKLIKEYQLEFADQLFDTDCSITIKVWIRQKVQIEEKLSHIEGCNVKDQP